MILFCSGGGAAEDISVGHNFLAYELTLIFIPNSARTGHSGSTAAERARASGKCRLRASTKLGHESRLR